MKMSASSCPEPYIPETVHQLPQECTEMAVLFKDVVTEQADKAGVYGEMGGKRGLGAMKRSVEG